MVVIYFTLIANHNNIIAMQLVAINLQPNFNLIKTKPKLIVCRTKVQLIMLITCSEYSTTIFNSRI